MIVLARNDLHLVDAVDFGSFLNMVVTFTAALGVLSLGRDWAGSGPVIATHVLFVLFVQLGSLGGKHHTNHVGV